MKRLTFRFSRVKAVLVLAAAALTFAAARPYVRNSLRVAASPAERQQGGQPQLPAAAAAHTDRVSRARLWPQLRPALSSLGDRLERPGKERLVVTGTLARGDEPAAPFVLTREFPDRLRLEETGARGRRVYVFNADHPAGGGVREREELDVVETLLFDTAEQFFAAQMRGAATRQVGQRVRLDDGSTPNYSGPYCAVYQVTEEARGGSPHSPRSKFYYFNADTMLLERVMYQSAGEGDARRQVEVRLSDWRTSEGQATPRRVVRVVDGTPVLTLTIEAARVAAKADDGSFGPQQ